MNFVKKNFKWIIAIIVSIILASGISVYATQTYLASQVTYKDSTVEQALNELYNIRNRKLTLVQDLSDTNGADINRRSSVSKSFNIEKNQEYYLVFAEMYTGGNKTTIWQSGKESRFSISFSNDIEYENLSSNLVVIKPHQSGNVTATITCTDNINDNNSHSYLFMQLYK